jgi:UDP-N-acetylmuramoylalanine--D-glutamate ligase
MELRRKRVMVIGLGVSGSAAAHFLAPRVASLLMVDHRTEIEASRLPSGEIRLGGENPAWLTGVDLIVTSPGVPSSSELLLQARAAHIPIIGELELASRFVAAPIVAVTGTNGKSTVTVMLGEILKLAGRRVFVGGNLGTPLIEAAGQVFDAAVVEASSYQLETIDRFRPKIAIYLNLTEDHLDRYRDFAEYRRAKERIFDNQTDVDWAVLNQDDPQVWDVAMRVRSRVVSFGIGRPQELPAIWSESGQLAYNLGDQKGTLSLERFQLMGAHNRLNAMAAAVAAMLLKAAPPTVEQGLAAFTGLHHRIELVREKGGVRFIDDSKGTNVGAVVEALAAFEGPVILLAGGVDKGGDYGPLRPALTGKVTLLILFGAARTKMSAALGDTTETTCVETLEQAVHLAARRAAPGATVLLSPACSSFDQFRDYAERGRKFQELVRAL